MLTQIDGTFTSIVLAKRTFTKVGFKMQIFGGFYTLGRCLPDYILFNFL